MVYTSLHCIGIWSLYCIHSSASNHHLLSFSVRDIYIYRSKHRVQRSIHSIHRHIDTTQI